MSRRMKEEHEASGIIAAQPYTLQLALPKNKDIILDDHDILFCTKEGPQYFRNSIEDLARTWAGDVAQRHIPCLAGTRHSKTKACLTQILKLSFINS